MDTTVSAAHEADGSARTRTVWSVVLAHHPAAEVVGLRLALGAGARLELGRRGKALGDEELLDDPRISRAHAELRVDGEDVFWVVDLGSRNGTYVNGARVERASLEEGDVVRVGDLLLVASRAPLGFGTRAPPGSALWGVSPRIEALRSSLKRVAAGRAPVALVGPVGAGRSAAARELHRLGGRPGGVVAVRASSLTAGELVGERAELLGLIRQADQGALVVRGVQDADARAQAALCELLERGAVRPRGADVWHSVDVRLIVTSVRSPSALVSEGTLSREFATRLGTAVVDVPGLEARVEDVAVLLRRFVRRFAGDDAAPSSGLVLHCLRRSWAGHVLELEAFVESAVLGWAGGAVDCPNAAPGVSTQAQPELRFAVDGSWFEVPGETRVTIGHRDHLRRLVAFLLEERERRPGAVATVERLFEAGWPGDRAKAKSGANRVYVALTELRRLGLRGALSRADGGYRLDSSGAFELVP